MTTLTSIVPDPDNVPRNAETRAVLSKFLSGTFEQKITVYQQIIGKLTLAKVELQTAQAMLPVYSYSTHYALQNITDRVRELEALIKVNQLHVANEKAKDISIAAAFKALDKELESYD